MTHNVLPSLPSILSTADVLRLIFFFPSGRNVERHVWQGSLSGGAVKQSRWGRLDDVPVPKNMISMYSWSLSRD